VVITKERIGDWGLRNPSGAIFSYHGGAIINTTTETPNICLFLSSFIGMPTTL